MKRKKKEEVLMNGRHTRQRDTGSLERVQCQ